MKNAARLALATICLAVLATSALAALATIGVHPPTGHLPDLLANGAGLGSIGGAGGLGLLPFAAAGKTKFFRVATEGATTDGREIKREWIDQIAKNFNSAKYGARVWLEHMRGVYPDSTFRAYGDVLAVEARDVEDGKRALFAQLDPLPDLVKIVNDDKQKIYTSIEVNPKFADTGEAYLVGLAVTDSPASTGTDRLSFATRHPTSNVISAAEPATIELEPEPVTDAGKFAKLLESFKKLLDRADPAAAAAPTPAPAATPQPGAEFAALAGAMQAMATTTAEHASATGQALAALQTQFAKLQADHAALLARLDAEPAASYTQRPAATGGNGRVLADC